MEKQLGGFKIKWNWDKDIGNRSIIADPRNSKMQKNLNLKIKFRESFRPFAPSILYSEVSKWFSQNIASPYMLFVSQVKDMEQGLIKKINFKLRTKPCKQVEKLKQ